MALRHWHGTITLVTLLMACATISVAQTQPAPEPQPSQAPSAQAPSDQAQSTPVKAVQKHPGQPCISVAQAATESSRDVCVSVHVYDVVELPDGTRFLDVCPADVSDEQCRFTLLSLSADRDDVGDLRRYRNQEIEVRGTVRSMHGRMGIIISHVRQFSGGPEKFRPNPRLLRGFNGQSDRMPVHDPNLAPAGHHRSFMNTREQETVQRKP
jgi:hypothetical protein